MKLPLPGEPFAPLQLSPAQCNEFEKLADALVRETLDEYEGFVTHQQRVVDRRLWKPIKSREKVTVYKEKVDDDVKAACDWKVPKLLAVGSIVGTLDDVMYGVTAPTDDAMLLKTSYINDEIADVRVLQQIRFANEEDPYRFLALRWLVKSSPTAVSALVKPRDLVLIEAMGQRLLPTGARVGYHLLHSVELPALCPDLSDKGFVRAKISACYLFKQVRKHAVEVFMTSLVEPGGSAVPESITVTSSANGLIGCWKLVWCAQNKKLAWLKKEIAQQRQVAGQSEEKTSDETKSSKRRKCALCSKKSSAFRKSPVRCELCRLAACSKCRVARKLSYVRQHAKGTTREVYQVPTVFCVDCVTAAKRVNSAEIARLEHVPGALASKHMAQAAASTQNQGRSAGHVVDVVRARTAAREALNSSICSFVEGEDDDDEDERLAVAGDSEESETRIESIEEWELRNALHSTSSSSEGSGIFI